MVFFVFYDYSGPFTVTSLPTGFQQVPGVQISDSCQWADAYWKIATESDVAASSCTITYSSGASGGSALVAFSDIADQSAPFRDTGCGYDTSGPAININPGVECDAGDLLVGYWINTGTYTATYYATQYQNPLVWTERFEATTSSRAHSLTDGVASGSGSTGTWSCTETGTARMCLIALAPKGDAVEPEPIDPFGMTGFFGA